MYIASLRLGADSLLIFCFYTYILKTAYSIYHKIRYSDNSCPYLGVCESRHNKYNTICLYLTLFLKSSLLIFPLIIAQSLLNFPKAVHSESCNGGKNYSSGKLLIAEMQKSPVRWLGLLVENAMRQVQLTQTCQMRNDGIYVNFFRKWGKN